MRLGDRLKQANVKDPSSPVDPSDDEVQGTDPVTAVKQRVRATLLERLGAKANDASMSEAAMRKLAIAELSAVIGEEQLPLTASEKKALADDITADLLGYGPMQIFLEDPTVTEVMANNTDGIWIERRGKLEMTDARFSSEIHLRRVIERIVGAVGRRIDESQPMVDARLPDGSRVNAIIPPLAVDGPALTIRKFTRDIFGPEDLVRIGTATEGVMAMLGACVEGKLNILVSGGTGTGKTTLLNALSSFIPADERIVTIEDAVELQLHQRHRIRLESRHRNIEGRGEITIRDLVRNALRMRPDRIIVGEVRGGEALDMLQAMNTGHEGSLSTLHANSPRDALARLETMVLMAGIELPVRAIREQMASAVDLIVHLSRLRDGSRRITHIVEVEGLENELITLNDLFEFDFGAGMDADGRFLGQLRPTGIRPKFSDKLADQGLSLGPEMFDGAIPASRRGRR